MHKINLYPNQTISPCRDCNDRTVGCHSNCDRYNEWLREERQKNEEYRKQKSLSREIDSYTIHHAEVVRKEQKQNKWKKYKR